jgi:hypothetical protein
MEMSDAPSLIEASGVSLRETTAESAALPPPEVPSVEEHVDVVPAMTLSSASSSPEPAVTDEVEPTSASPSPEPSVVPQQEPRPCPDDVRLFRQFTITPLRSDFPGGVNCRIDFPVPVPTGLKVFVREILHLQILQFDPFIVRGYVPPAHMNLVIEKWRAHQGI